MRWWVYTGVSRTDTSTIDHGQILEDTHHLSIEVQSFGHFDPNSHNLVWSSGRDSAFRADRRSLGWIANFFSFFSPSKQTSTWGCNFLEHEAKCVRINGLEEHSASWGGRTVTAGAHGRFASMRKAKVIEKDHTHLQKLAVAFPRKVLLTHRVWESIIFVLKQRLKKPVHWQWYTCNLDTWMQIPKVTHMYRTGVRQLTLYQCESRWWGGVEG